MFNYYFDYINNYDVELTSISKYVDTSFLRLEDEVDEFSYEEIKQEGYVEQGITITNNVVLITAYDKKAEKENSKIYVYDVKTGNYKGQIILNNKAHVGGITYDSNNNILFVTGSKGKINAYDYKKINKVINDDNFILFLDDGYVIDCDISMPDNKSAATIYYYNNDLFIASYEGFKNGKLLKINYNYDKKSNKINVSDSYVTSIENQVQGIAFTEYNNKNYMIITQSIAMLKSNILIYEFDTNINKYVLIGSVKDRKGIEGIYITSSGKIIKTFESGNQKIDIITIGDLISSINKEKNNPGYDVISKISGMFYEYQRKR